MPRQPIYFDQEVVDRLKGYTKQKYGNRRALSLVVQSAVTRFLDEEEIKSGKKRTTRPKAF